MPTFDTPPFAAHGPHNRSQRLAFIFVVLLALTLAAAGLAAWLLAGSRARLIGQASLSGLTAPVTLSRDALGIATIEAENAIDAMRVLGYTHAQERYFEMDLSRRLAAGELAELVGSKALEIDRQHRLHHLRARAATDLVRLDGFQRSVLQAYADGVNAGLSDLRVRPWPYLLLRQAPRPWASADSLLVGMAMYFDLQDASDADALAHWQLQQALPAPLFDLLQRDGTTWDAPLLGSPRGNAGLPTSAEVNLRDLPAPAHVAHQPARSDADLVGSNNFAIAGRLTSDGRAIIENDMHLTLRAPNIWFRARLRYADSQAPGGRVDITGFSLPGLPAIVVGSTGHIAWGFTNSYIDTADWRHLRPCAAGATPGCMPVRTRTEVIRIAGAPPQTLRVEETDWGPILHRTPDGNAYALRWAAHLPGALNLGLIRLTHARNVHEALALGDQVALPTQNLVVADRDGHIGWRLLGPIPQRAASCSARHWVEEDTPACPPWTLATDRAPRLYDPPDGRLWTANARTLDGAALIAVGDGGYDLGARARQIRDALAAQPRFDERALLQIALDDRALLLSPWHDFLQAQATRQRTPALQALAAASRDWTGHASTESAGYRIVRAWRQAVLDCIAEGLIAPARTRLGPNFKLPKFRQLEGTAWPLVQQQPAHLLPRAFTSWPALFEQAAQTVQAELTRHGPLTQRTWGEYNTTRICHPLSSALPSPFARALCMPHVPLPGDANMPRVQGPSFGASERIVVSPGHEEDGIIHMPGGQSDHPLSPFWGAGHAAWVEGQPTAFLPGPARYRLRLYPDDATSPR
ncbi:MAG: penicillin acylase family protein [Thermomonas haemolytica]